MAVLDPYYNFEEVQETYGCGKSKAATVIYYIRLGPVYDICTLQYLG